MKLTAYPDAVVLKRPKDNSELTKSGLFIPSREVPKREDDRVQLHSAEVVSVGTKVKDDIKVGDTAFYNAYDSWDMEDGGVVYTSIKAKDVQGIQR